MSKETFAEAAGLSGIELVIVELLITVLLSFLVGDT
jgi:hypothetical protein